MTSEEDRVRNPYGLSKAQWDKLDEAEDRFERSDLVGAEKLYEELLTEIPNCIPVLNNLGELNSSGFGDFEKAVSYYERVLKLEPDNDWAMAEKRRLSRWLTYD